MKPNPLAEQEGIAGYEIALNFNALPFELIPRAASELKGRSKFQVLNVNEAKEKKNPGRRLLTQRSGHWELAHHGVQTLELLTY